LRHAALRIDPCPSAGPLRVAGTLRTLPLLPDFVDVFVANFVLCSVDDPEAALLEISRALSPTGSYMGLEHCANPTALLRSVQRLRNRIRVRSGLCSLGQDVIGRLQAAGFEVSVLRQPEWSSPVVMFEARKPIAM
jgi:hypothetical protein